MTKHRYNWGVLFILVSLLVASCHDDEPNTPALEPNSPINTEDVDKVLKNATTEWGLSSEAVIKHMDGYIRITSTEKEILLFKPEKGEQRISYRFSDDKLIATAILLPTTSTDIEYQSLLNGYKHLGKLNDGDIYENTSVNTMASVWIPVEGNSSYSAIGFAPMTYNNYGADSSITVTTGDVTSIDTKTATISGSLMGVTANVEVGILYGTESTLTEQNNKQSTTSRSNYSVTLTGLSSNTTYYYRAYAIVDEIYYYGDVMTFKTKDYAKSFTFNGVTYNMILVEGCPTGDFYIMDKEIPGDAFDSSGDGFVTYSELEGAALKLREISGMPLRPPYVNEWQYAACGGNKSKGYKYSGSDVVGDVAWYSGNSSHKPQKSGLKKPNELGIYDMSGNWAEICAGEKYLGDDNDFWYQYVCGGSCDNSATDCQVNSKKAAITTGYWRNVIDIYDPDKDLGHIGFRFVYTKGH